MYFCLCICVNICANICVFVSLSGSFGVCYCFYHHSLLCFSFRAKRMCILHTFLHGFCTHPRCSIFKLTTTPRLKHPTKCSQSILTPLFHARKVENCLPTSPLPLNIAQDTLRNKLPFYFMDALTLVALEVIILISCIMLWQFYAHNQVHVNTQTV